MKFAVVAAVVLSTTVARADEGVPSALALKVMLKVLSYDPALTQHGSGDFVVVVPFAAGGEAAADALVREGATLEVKSVNERPLKFVSLAVKDVAGAKPSAVLFSKSLSDDSRRELIKWARESKTYSLSLSETAVSEGALLGVGVANEKPQPLINITTARALGADFKAVLRLARTFQ